MVHALCEARRVLKPNSILIDLRPAIRHRHVGIVRGGRYTELGTMRERFDEDRAANRAIAHVLGKKLFRREWRTQIECDRAFGTLGAYRDWMSEFTQLGGLPAHDSLVQRVEQASKGQRGKSKIVVSAPLVMRVLSKVGTRPRGSTPSRRGLACRPTTRCS